MLPAPRSPLPPNRRPAILKGFTLIEMLVVIAIIGILASIVVTVATRVTKGGQRSATMNILQRMDGLLTNYLTKTDGSLPAYVRTRQTQMNTDPARSNDPAEDQVDSASEWLFPLVDGRFDGRTFPFVPEGAGAADQFDPKLDPPQPSAALLLLAMSEIPELAESIASIDPKFIQRRDVWAWGWALDANRVPTGGPVKRRLRIPVVVDGFGNPIRFVHPTFSGGYGRYYYPTTVGAGGWAVDGSDPRHPVRPVRTWRPPATPPASPAAAGFSRSYRPFDLDSASSTLVGDADEGIGPAGRAYFYSPGLDNDPGARRDNVYTSQPTFPAETTGID
jgi:prepilin-type N-terminal cleavage/methylation domain-containing protein